MALPDTDGTPAPVRVIIADAGTDLPDLPGDGRYVSALVFAVRDGQLIGEVEVPLKGCALSGAELSAHLRDALGERWSAPAPPAPAAPPDEPLPFVSVVIATTMQRVDELDRCLDSLLALDYPDFEVILVDNRPDASPERAALHGRFERDPRVRLVGEARPGISAARNRGAREARGELIAFTDDDAVARPNWLRAIARRFAAEPDVDCVSGVVLPAELETPAQIWFERSGSKLQQWYQATSLDGSGAAGVRGLRRLGPARFQIAATVDGTDAGRYLVYRAGRFAMGANIAVRRTALASIGGFDERLGTGTAARGGEDIAAIARLLYSGGRVTMDPASIVLHYHRRDYAGSRTQMYGYGVGLTAALSALVRSDPRHLVGLMYVIAPGLRALFGKSADRKADSYPKELARIELRGLVAGPFAYARSLLAATRRT